MKENLNTGIASRLDEVAILLEQQGASLFRVRAYHNAAQTLRGLNRSVDEILKSEGLEGLEKLPAVGTSLARSIRSLVQSGNLPLLERLRGEGDPEKALQTVPGIGPKLAELLHDELGIESLEHLEQAAYDGRLRNLAGFGEKRLAGIRDLLAQRLGRLRQRQVSNRRHPGVEELLEIDRDYREKSEAGVLRNITPRRFNPKAEAWLPIFHTHRGGYAYTALYSNTARAHALGTTRDWVVIYCDDGSGEQAYTVITAQYGKLKGQRIVRGREAECEQHYASGAQPQQLHQPPALNAESPMIKAL
ncbi:MAG: helix-hairpin-helix domain-containing protein [Meiothermus sp.]|nr:helix-hairpin-helix domain-containing protein [Meiothermus sp.]